MTLVSKPIPSSWSRELVVRSVDLWKGRTIAMSLKALSFQNNVQRTHLLMKRFTLATDERWWYVPIQCLYCSLDIAHVKTSQNDNLCGLVLLTQVFMSALVLFERYLLQEFINKNVTD